MNAGLATYVSIPIISALVGWITNYIAVRMLFRPRMPVRILGLTFHGVIPKRKADLARKIGTTVERELISHRDIQQVMNTPAFHEEVGRVIGQKADDFIRATFGSGSLVSLLLSSDTAAHIRRALLDEVQKLVPDAMELLVDKMESKVDFSEIVRTKIEGFDLQRLEGIIYGIASRELRSIEIWGGVLGFAVGVIQVAVLWLGSRYV